MIELRIYFDRLKEVTAMVVLFSIKAKEKYQQQLKKSFPEVTFIFKDSMGEAMEDLEKAKVLVTFSAQVTGEVINRAPELEWIMVMTAGVDKLPKDIINEKNILVTNARGIHKTPMAEYAISMLLQVTRNEKKIIENEAAHKWDQVPVDEMSGKTLLVAGTGAIGSEVARLAKAFNMKTIGLSRSGRSKAYFDEVFTNEKKQLKLQEADFVVSVLPSTPQTTHFFTYEDFKQMPDHAVFLNMGRGDVLELDELTLALREKEIAHAILDVFHEEPLPEGHYLWDEENVTITPHLSGLTPHYTTRALDIFAHNLKKFTKNEADLMNQVDILRGY